MALQRVRSLATTKFTDETVANAYTPAAGEMISIFVNGTYRGLRIGDGATVGGLSLVNSGSELYEYIGEAPPDNTDLPVVDPVEDSDSGEISTPAPVVDVKTGLVEQTLVDVRLSGMDSLYFDGNSKLTPSWTPNSNTDSKTWSLWVKRSGAKFDTHDYFLGAFVPGDSPTYTNTFDVAFNPNNKLICQWGGSDNQARDNISLGTYKDVSWHHIVISQTLTSCSIFVDGEKIQLGTSNNPSGSPEQFLKSPGTGNYGSFIGGGGFNGGNGFNGRMANIQFIDGMALDANYFGEYLGANWVPKVYEGAYGANGFHLDFSDLLFVDETDDLATVKDVSGNENHWQAA